MIFLLSTIYYNKNNNNGSANFGSHCFSDSDKIIFSSNLQDPKRRNFDLYSINIDGIGLGRITFSDGFD